MISGIEALYLFFGAVCAGLAQVVVEGILLLKFGDNLQSRVIAAVVTLVLCFLGLCYLKDTKDTDKYGRFVRSKRLVEFEIRAEDQLFDHANRLAQPRTNPSFL
jgi:hypothetical protein